ncbi:MAG: PH domain-containing protein [Porphyrobacter sp.]|nr:PH domain-containing protein [Porphyrobacter sp.]
MSEPRHTAPLSVLVGALNAIRSAIVPAIAVAFSGIGGSGRILVALGVGVAAIVIGSAISYVGWRRLTYTVGAADIRVESGILGRAARSVPYERIQDVSLEAKLLPRLLGLVAVKFETGAGAGEDISLQYLTAAEGERLRRLVRERRDEEQAAAAPTDCEAASPTAEEDEGEVLFTLPPRRLLTFGLFEFSLAVFAVLGGALQYVDNFTGINIWNVALWRDFLEERGVDWMTLDARLQALGALTGLLGLVIIGFATGIARTVTREWDFVLTRSARGFRRRRGLFTRTDVVMPVHRVQALEIGTGLLRYRFGWHGLSFVSLAQDAGDASHVVAPFARMEEIAPIVAAAGFRLPDAATHWHRASRNYLVDRIVIETAIPLLATIPAAILAPFGVALIPLGLAVLLAGANLYAWEFRRHAIDETQVYTSHGFLSPQQQVATRLKLHSVEIAQGPIARWRGYATIHLGLAGGTFAMHGVPIEEARAVRRAVLATIAATDFSRLDTPPAAEVQALSSAQSGFSSNFAAT